MDKSELNKREIEIYEKYQNIIMPYIMELEVRDVEYPIEIMNEVRAVFTHLSRYKVQCSEKDLYSAENHIKRAILDCYKYLCISIAESVYRFRAILLHFYGKLYALCCNLYSFSHFTLEHGYFLCFVCFLTI